MTMKQLFKADDYGIGLRYRQIICYDSLTYTTYYDKNYMQLIEEFPNRQVDNLYVKKNQFYILMR